MRPPPGGARSARPRVPAETVSGGQVWNSLPGAKLRRYRAIF